MPELPPLTPRLDTAASQASRRSESSSASKGKDSYRSRSARCGSAYVNDQGYYGRAWMANSRQSTLPWANGSLYLPQGKVCPAQMKKNEGTMFTAPPGYCGHIRGKHCENVLGATVQRANRIAADMIRETDILGGCRNVPPRDRRPILTDSHGMPAQRKGVYTVQLHSMPDQTPYVAYREQMKAAQMDSSA
eukprot:gnl/MRDRNA2_/MRDRNA2_90027_c0_seq1.p1 gnl/MRDRNA2_/MRDRNA2_90027_c0~~gnl/MRDRNA2_/MRDRNA2_90027_c0_seq1.p1  ORF type:complete len:191 (+),score=22.38 gnl/MRDRNA2_/MRDRNA2_90027_c0_seq1:58-630(+)